MKRAILLPILLTIILGPSIAVSLDDYAARRFRLVRHLEKSGKRAVWWKDGKGFDPRVLEAMKRVPRHLFVPKKLRSYAYKNRPLSIGYGQTISQPLIVALMTDLLETTPGQIVLEIGTGSGYQAAILADLGLRVYTIEIIEPIAKAAKKRLEKLGYRTITTRWGDGYKGWKEEAPFDAIIVTAAGNHIPSPLLAQLKPGGRMVIPVGHNFMTQRLVLVRKDMEGRIITKHLLPVRFVPLTRRR
jgi:protein-L-isoaspartate(D-aspartate) O-methyltransferase